MFYFTLENIKKKKKKKNLKKITNYYISYLLLKNNFNY